MAIEQTNKRWKIMTLVGVLMMLISPVGWWALGFDTGSYVVVPVASAGVFACIVARFGAWWTNG